MASPCLPIRRRWTTVPRVDIKASKLPRLRSVSWLRRTQKRLNACLRQLLLAANDCFGWLKAANSPHSCHLPTLPTHLLPITLVNHHSHTRDSKITATTTINFISPVSARARHVDNRPTPRDLAAQNRRKRPSASCSLGLTPHHHGSISASFPGLCVVERLKHMAVQVSIPEHPAPLLSRPHHLRSSCWLLRLAGNLYRQDALGLGESLMDFVCVISTKRDAGFCVVAAR